MKNKKYLNDFKLANDDIHYEYKGIIYYLKNEKEKTSKTLAGLAILLTSIIVVSGILPFEGTSGYFYIIFPFIIEFCLLGLIDYEIIVFIKNINELREYRYEKTVEPLQHQFMLMMIISLTSIISTSFFLIASKFSMFGLVYLIMHIVLAMVSRYSHVYIKNLKFEKKKA